MRAVEITLELQEYFGEFHDDWKEMFQVQAETLVFVLTVMERIYTLAWGYFPENLETWLK